MKRVLYDTNVILDVLLKRKLHYSASSRALDVVGRGKVEGYLAGHAVTTIDYILQRNLHSTKKSRQILARLLEKLHVAPITDLVIRQALTSPIKDFEDAVTHASAMEAAVDIIITRNIGDFKNSIVPIVLPDMFRIEY